MQRLLKQATVLKTVLVIGASFAALPAHAGEISINYDRFSFFEEPIAYNVLGFTVSHNALFDVAFETEEHSDKFDVIPSSFFEVNIERQLPNALTIGASYFGSYEEDVDDTLQSNWAAYVSGIWGGIFIGDVVEQVREETRRFRGVGNAELAFDDFYGLADSTGVLYRGRYSAFVVTSATDDNGHYDFGLSYRRPRELFDNRFTLRTNKGEFYAVDGSGAVETTGFAAVGEIVYGSLLVDASIGYEHFDGRFQSEERIYSSFGLNYKMNAISLSLEGHYGQIEDGEEVSFAVGGRYDIARGASLNLGYNYHDTDASLASEDDRESKVRMSLRYEY